MTTVLGVREDILEGDRVCYKKVYIGFDKRTFKARVGLDICAGLILGFWTSSIRGTMSNPGSSWLSVAPESCYSGHGSFSGHGSDNTPVA